MNDQAATLFSALQALRKDYFLWALLGLLILLTAAKPGQLAFYPGLVNWQTIAALTGLLVLTKGVEFSGYLHHLGKRLILRMPTDRAMALFLVLAAALLFALRTK